MKCDLCGKEINIHEVVQESKLCRSCFSMFNDEQNGDDLKLSEKPVIKCSACQKQAYVYYEIDDEIICGRCIGGEDTPNAEALNQTSPFPAKPTGYSRLLFFSLIAICSMGGLLLLSPYIFWGLICLAMWSDESTFKRANPPQSTELTMRNGGKILIRSEAKLYPGFQDPSEIVNESHFFYVPPNGASYEFYDISSSGWYSPDCNEQIKTWVREYDIENGFKIVFNEYRCSRSSRITFQVSGEKRRPELLEKDQYNAENTFTWLIRTDGQSPYMTSSILNQVEDSIGHPNPLYRSKAAIVLGSVKTDNSYGLLLLATKDSDKTVRANALESLGRIGSPGGINH